MYKMTFELNREYKLREFLNRGFEMKNRVGGRKSRGCYSHDTYKFENYSRNMIYIGEMVNDKVRPIAYYDFETGETRRIVEEDGVE
jgi:hypothetical protein